MTEQEKTILSAEELFEQLRHQPDTTAVELWITEQMGNSHLPPIMRALLGRFGELRLQTGIMRAQDGEVPTLKTVCLADVQPRKVNWLWHGYVPFGCLTVIQGDPGVGKGTLTLDLAARASRGFPMPLCSLEYEPISTLLMTVAEDDLEATISPRLEAAGADCSRLHAFTDLVSIPEDLPLVREQIEAHKARLLIVDPLNAYLSGKVDSHKDQDVRKALSPLKVLAEEMGCAVIAVTHLNKSGGGNAMYRGVGSIGIVGAARSVFLVAVDPQNPEQRVMARVKGNLSEPPPSLAFSLESAGSYGASRIRWHGVTDYTADSLLSRPRMDEGNATSEVAREGKEEAVEEAFRALAGEATIEQIAGYLEWPDPEKARRTINRMLLVGRVIETGKEVSPMSGRGRKAVVFRLVETKQQSEQLSSHYPHSIEGEENEEIEENYDLSSLSSLTSLSESEGIEAIDDL